MCSHPSLNTTLFPIAADPLNQLEVLCPRAYFTCYALWFGIIYLGGSATIPTANANEAPDGVFGAVHTTMVVYGYTTTRGGVDPRVQPVCSL